MARMRGSAKKKIKYEEKIKEEKKKIKREIKTKGEKKEF